MPRAFRIWMLSLALLGAGTGVAWAQCPPGEIPFDSDGDSVDDSCCVGTVFGTVGDPINPEFCCAPGTEGYAAAGPDPNDVDVVTACCAGVGIDTDLDSVSDTCATGGDVPLADRRVLVLMTLLLAAAGSVVVRR